MSYALKVTSVPTGDGGEQTCMATIEVIDEHGNVRADVMVEVYEDRPRLVITAAIVERNSDDVSSIIDLLTGDELPI